MAPDHPKNAKAHHTSPVPAPLPNPTDTSTSANVPSTSSSKAPEFSLPKSVPMSPSSDQNPRPKLCEPPKFTMSPDSKDGNIILVLDSKIDPFNCKYVPKPRKLPRSGKKKIFLDQNLDAGRMDIPGKCRFCGESVTSCYVDLHILTCSSFDQADVVSFYKNSAIMYKKENHVIETVALNYCLYLLHESHDSCNINQLFDLKSISMFLIDLEAFLAARAAKMFKALGFTNPRRFNILKYL